MLLLFRADGGRIMTGLFGEFEATKPKKKKNPTLLDMAKEKFGSDAELMKEIELYLKSRRQAHNYPSKVSWEMQLNLLEQVSPEKRANQVRTSTLRGYRQIAFDNTCDKSGVSNVKANPNTRCTEGF